MSVMVCRRTSAQDFLRYADVALLIRNWKPIFQCRRCNVHSRWNWDRLIRRHSKVRWHCFSLLLWGS